MAHEDFEHIVKSRFQGFESKPPESVWSGISNFRDRRKRLFYLWWILPILAVAGGSLFLYSENASEPELSISQFTVYHGNYNSSTESIVKDNQAIKKAVILDKSGDSSAKVLTPTSAVRTPEMSTLQSTPTPPLTSTIQEKNTEVAISKMDVLSARIEDTITQGPIDLRPAIQHICPAPWRKSVGIQIGTFFSLSPANANWSEPPTTLIPTSLESANNDTYQRFLEVAPYFAWKHFGRDIEFRTSVIYAAANLSATRDGDTFLGNQSSFGIGLGSSYTFIHKRMQISVYLQLQGERSVTRFTNGDSYPWFTADGQSGTSSNITAAPPSRYTQYVLSGEAGVRFEYGLPNPYWRITGGIGYRNYFWQQQVQSPTNVAVIELPQLMQTHLGVSFSF